MPKIGMRIIKSAIAVMLCFAISLFRPNGLVFYSVIAAILCMQNYITDSLQIALTRVIGTLIGGVFGMGVLYLLRTFLPEIPLPWEYLLISLAIIPLIYLTVLLHETTASYISCVVFLSVLVGQQAIALSPLLLASNRMLDTLIGIGVSLSVNAFHLPRKLHNEMLFVSDLDGTLLNSAGQLTVLTTVKLNKLLQEGAQITLATSRTPTTLIPMLADVQVTLPIITMNGAALYDMRQKEYLSIIPMDYEISRCIVELFNQQGRNSFCHTIYNDILHIYYQDFTNPAEEHYYNAKKLMPLKTYIHSAVPAEQEIIYIVTLDRKDVIVKLYRQLLASEFATQINASYYEDEYDLGYYFLKITDAKASKIKAAQEIQQICGAAKIIAFGDNISDKELIREADCSYAVANAIDSIKALADHQIEANTTDSVIRTIEKIYHSHKGV